MLDGLPRAGWWVVSMPPTRTHPAAGRQWTERRRLGELKRVLAGRLHTVRYSFVSHALLKGTPAAVVREWVGYLSEEVQRQYTHVHEAASQAAMRRLAGDEPPAANGD